jgi:hypothetical protein
MTLVRVLAATTAIGCLALSACSSNSHKGGEPSPTPTATVVYPPRTTAEAKALAATGDPSKIHVFRVVAHPVGERCGAAGSPDPVDYATVDPGISGHVLAADELAAYTKIFGWKDTCSDLYLDESAKQYTVPFGFSVGAIQGNDSNAFVFTSGENIKSLPAFVVSL